VVLQAVFRMGSGAVFSHSQIMPEIAPLRQVSPGSAPKGGHSSPGLKTWGFLADFINNKLHSFNISILITYLKLI
jgi:hypothetical protein